MKLQEPPAGSASTIPRLFEVSTTPAPDDSSAARHAARRAGNAARPAALRTGSSQIDWQGATAKVTSIVDTANIRRARFPEPPRLWQGGLRRRCGKTKTRLSFTRQALRAVPPRSSAMKGKAASRLHSTRTSN